LKTASPDGATADYRLVPLAEEHCAQMLRIFNHHVAEGFAAYPEAPLSEEAVAALLRQTVGYPAVAAEGPNGRLLGFGFMRPYSPYSTFSHTALITYFIDARHVHRGIGTALLRRLEEEARTRGITRILAHISSRNPASLAFHSKNGFTECGRFPEIGRKRGEPFDVLWMIKSLS
jgi:L-amino acid N-acyltransferase YncA